MDEPLSNQDAQKLVREILKGYRVQTNRIAVVVAFETKTELTVVTVWRF